MNGQRTRPSHTAGVRVAGEEADSAGDETGDNAATELEPMCSPHQSNSTDADGMFRSPATDDDTRDTQVEFYSGNNTITK